MTVEELEKKIQVLENENRLLKERLSEAGISYADILDETTDGENELYDPDQGARIREIRITDKVANDFFMMFCRGRKRKEVYELPVDAIREMIVNAECHRNMTDESCVQVVIYDDRLEVTSPGGLYNGLTFEEAIEGHSKLRNRAIANAFSQIGLIEAWETGLQRIQSAAKEYGLPDVEFIEMPESFRVNLYRSSLPMDGIGETSVEHRQKNGVATVDTPFNLELNSTQIKIIELLSANSNMTGVDLSEAIGISKRNIEVNLKKLKEKGVLVRHGSSKGGYWEVKAHE